MADKDQKTEQPTQRRMKKAREEGNFPTARVFVGALQFLAFVSLIHAWGLVWINAIRDSMAALFQHALDPRLTGEEIIALSLDLLKRTMIPVAYLGAVLIAITLAVQLGVTRMGVSLKKLVPDIDRCAQPGPIEANHDSGGLPGSRTDRYYACSAAWSHSDGRQPQETRARHQASQPAFQAAGIAETEPAVATPGHRHDPCFRPGNLLFGQGRFPELSLASPAHSALGPESRSRLHPGAVVEGIFCFHNVRSSRPGAPETPVPGRSEDEQTGDPRRIQRSGR